ncbi:hypothetical protein L6164_012333 [Bauhinia variegata]|uniref:Uncharacterized protein n=1 Tax=Bauhinia variegata TaxID=167791 RepID=A0ACB9PEX1_BAUVA|nr:hypothetical protein L6164_012333 [Bauhinia variegata]
MLSSLRLQPANGALRSNTQKTFVGNAEVRCKLLIRSRPIQRFSSLTLETPSDAAAPSASEPPHYTSTVGSSLLSSSLQLSHWNFSQRHITVLNVVACLTAISATWLFCSAIPTLLAFKRAAESLEKLMDVTREEIPDTMAAIRLSGMEISDLTMELSDLGRGITQGVKSSTRAVRVAKEGLGRLTNMAPSGSDHPKS